MGKKNLVLEDIYKACLERGDMTFHNDMVKTLSRERGFGNQFDTTKLDSTDKLPQFMLDADVFILHMGSGYHKFIKWISTLYHRFEAIAPSDTVIWDYRKSLLNEYDSSESNILSVATNQRILHDFLFGKDIEYDNLPIDERPKTYFPHRTNADLDYYFGDEHIVAHRQQMEVDLTIEYKGQICVLEAKNGIPTDFNIYQLYNPFLYYYKAFPNNKILCLYLVRNGDSLKLYLYTFATPLQLGSITFLRNREYILRRS